MAYANATAAYDSKAFGESIWSYATTNAGGTASTHIYKGSQVCLALATGTLVIAEDTATYQLVGVAAETQRTDAIAGAFLKVYLPGTKLWLKTLDTAAVTKLGFIAFPDVTAATGTPQHVVTAATATTTPNSNLTGVTGRVIGWVSGAYLVDTTLMSVIADHANLNIETT